MQQLKLVQSDSVCATEVDVDMMKRAIELANRAAAMEEVPVGAVVYRGNEIVAEAHNNRESSADPTGHAELLAIRLASEKLDSWRLNDCSLAVTLEPCPMCAGAIVNSRIGRVVYGATDPKAGACESLYEITSDDRLNHQVNMVSGVLADECSKLLKDFFKERRRINRQRRLREAS